MCTLPGRALETTDEQAAINTDTGHSTGAYGLMVLVDDGIRIHIHRHNSPIEYSEILIKR